MGFLQNALLKKIVVIKYGTDEVSLCLIKTKKYIEKLNANTKN